MPCLHRSLPRVACGSWECPWSCSRRGERGASHPPTSSPTTRGRRGRTRCHPCSDRAWQPLSALGVGGTELGCELGPKSQKRDGGSDFRIDTDKKCVGLSHVPMMAKKDKEKKRWSDEKLVSRTGLSKGKCHTPCHDEMCVLTSRGW